MAHKWLARAKANWIYTKTHSVLRIAAHMRLLSNTTLVSRYHNFQNKYCSADKTRPRLNALRLARCKTHFTLSRRFILSEQQHIHTEPRNGAASCVFDNHIRFGSRLAERRQFALIMSHLFADSNRGNTWLQYTVWVNRTKQACRYKWKRTRGEGGEGENLKEICKLKLQINDHLNMKHINSNQTRRETMWLCVCVCVGAIRRLGLARRWLRVRTQSEMAAKDIALIGHIRWVRHMSHDSMHDNGFGFVHMFSYTKQYICILTLKVWICGHHWINSYKLPHEVVCGVCVSVAEEYGARPRSKCAAYYYVLCDVLYSVLVVHTQMHTNYVLMGLQWIH